MDDKGQPRRRRIGIRDIAERTSLSKTAVSYALNGTGRLDPETRARVIEVARELGYRANHHARNLRRRSFGVLSISTSLPTAMSEAVPGMDYFLRVWQGAVSKALERGYMLLLAPFGTRSKALLDMPIDGGIVIDPVYGDTVSSRLEAQGLPVVLIGRDLKRPANKSWRVDSPHGELATETFAHFASRGARRVGLIQASGRYSYGIAVRAAYLDWIAASGSEPLIVEIDSAANESAGYTAAMRLLESPDPPDAIYASLDRLAVGALFAAERCGIDVPGKLLLASGSDGITRTARVPITSLDLQPDKLGQTAVTMLIDRIEHHIKPCEVIIPGSVQIRESSKPQ